MVLNRTPPPSQDSLRVNDQIRISPLRVVDDEGRMLGVIPRDEAMNIAREKGLDLVEVAPTERPPVCRLMDYGKFRYEQSRKTRKQKAHQQQLKEIRVRPQCGQHDLEVKIKHAREFLDDKDKVQITVQFRGREMAHIEMGLDLVRSMVDKLSDVAKIEKPPIKEGKRITALLAPK